MRNPFEIYCGKNDSPEKMGKTFKKLAMKYHPIKYTLDQEK